MRLCDIGFNYHFQHVLDYVFEHKYWYKNNNLLLFKSIKLFLYRKKYKKKNNSSKYFDL